MFRWVLHSAIYFIVLQSFGQVKNMESPNGMNIYYYPNGQIASKGNMVNGNPDGLWKAYYVDGTLKSEGLRKNGLLDSVWIFYDENGLLKSQIDYRDGKKNGYYYSFLSKFKGDSLKDVYLERKELYLNNKRHGLSVYFYLNGQISRTVNFYEGLINGTSRIFDTTGLCIVLIEYRNGKEIDRESINQYVDGLKSGVWKEFYDNGRIKTERSYIGGLLNGLYKSFDSTGELLFTHRYEKDFLVDTAVIVENQIDLVESFYNLRNKNGEFIMKSSGGFIDGIAIGVHRTYDSLGRVNSSKLYNNKGNLIGKGIVNEEGDRLGNWIFYYENGSIKSKGTYSDNRRVGQWLYYYQNGSIEQKGSFNRGLPNNLWTWYYENGRIKREENYYLGLENGECYEYDEEGLIIVQGKYNEGLKDKEWFYNYYFHNERGNYKEGLREGIWEYHYKNENLYFIGNFIQGNPDGKHIFYYKNGKIKEVQYYFLGMRISNWKLYSENGVLLNVNTYLKDSLVKINGIDVIIN
jgi:antitoxin component YwqK of YwqJK toxin-antitoxin module